MQPPGPDAPRPILPSPSNAPQQPPWALCSGGISGAGLCQRRSLRERSQGCAEPRQPVSWGTGEQGALLVPVAGTHPMPSAPPRPAGRRAFRQQVAPSSPSLGPSHRPPGPPRSVRSSWFPSLRGPRRRGRSGVPPSGAPWGSAPGGVPTLRPSTTGAVGALGHRPGHYASVFSAAK